jgi:TPR repeat protein
MTNNHDIITEVEGFLSGQALSTDANEAARQLSKMWKEGNAQAAYLLAELIFEGVVDKSDDQEAFELLQKAAKADDLQAAWLLFSILKNGQHPVIDTSLDLEPDPLEAFNWQLRAGELGHPEALLSLASALLDQGKLNEAMVLVKQVETLKADSPREERLIIKAQPEAKKLKKDILIKENEDKEMAKIVKKAQQGDALSQYNLGIYLLNKSGVEQEAVEWITKAADQEFSPAMRWLKQYIKSSR